MVIHSSNYTTGRHLHWIQAGTSTRRMRPSGLADLRLPLHASPRRSGGTCPGEPGSRGFPLLLQDHLRPTEHVHFRGRRGRLLLSLLGWRFLAPRAKFALLVDGGGADRA